MRLWIAVLAAFLLNSTSGYASQAQRARGAAVFAASGCAHCHSIRGSGGHKGPDLSGVGRRMKVSRMRKQIADGSQRMPPFKEELQDTEFKDLLTYLHSCKDKK